MHQSTDPVVPCAAAGAAKLLLVSTGTADMTAAKPLLPRATPAAGGCCLQRHDSPEELAACCRSCQLAGQLSHWMWQLWQTQMPKPQTDYCRASHSEAGCAGAGSERRSRSASAAESGSAGRASPSSDAASDSTCTAGPQSSCIHELARTDQCEPRRSGHGSKAAHAGAQHGQLQVQGTEMRASSGKRTSSDKARTSSRPPPPAAPCTKLCRPLKQPGSARQMMVTCTGRTGRGAPRTIAVRPTMLCPHEQSEHVVDVHTVTVKKQCEAVETAKLWALSTCENVVS